MNGMEARVEHRNIVTDTRPAADIDPRSAEDMNSRVQRNLVAKNDSPLRNRSQANPGRFIPQADIVANDQGSGVPEIRHATPHAQAPPRLAALRAESHHCQPRVKMIQLCRQKLQCQTRSPTGAHATSMSRKPE